METGDIGCQALPPAGLFVTVPTIWIPLEEPMKSCQLVERVKSIARVLPALLLFFATAEASEAVMLQGTITGQVVGAENQQPLGGAQVLVEGTGVGALTNQAGQFTLTEVPAGEQTVAVQLLGFARATQTVQVTSGETVNLNFEITRQALALDEMVVTGTPGGTQRRALGHDISRISASELAESMPRTDFQGIMRGQAAGAYVQPAAGTVGAGNHMRMRGISSISLSSYPLIYVDGVRVSNERGGSQSANRDPSPALRMNDFSPDEIESIEIIKGPSAATLYGTEASAGVIQIITRRGASGAPQWEAGIEAGANYMRDPGGRLNWNYQIDPTGEVTGQPGALTRWHPVHSPQESPHAFQSGLRQNYSLGVRGGTDRVRYALSGSFGDEEGYLDWNTQRRNNLRANMDVVLTESLDAQFSSGFINQDTSFPVAMNPYGYPGSWHWGHALRTANDGHYVLRPEEERLIEHLSDVSRSTWSLTLNHNPTDWFRQRFIVGEDQTVETTDLRIRRQPEGANHPGLAGRGLGMMDRDVNELSYLSMDYGATVSFDLNPNWTSSTSTGVQYYDNTREVSTLRGEEFVALGLTAPDGLASVIGGGTRIANSSLGVYLQQEFGWQNRAFLTAAVRGDDNSAFGADFDAAIYPKVSGTWVVSEEEWWDLFWVNSFRVRGAWGQAGRQPDVFAAVSLYEPYRGPGGAPAVRTGALGNPDLGPEVGEEIEVGFDAALWNERFSVTFNFYDQRTRDAMLNVRSSVATGFMQARVENVGLVTNRGIELQLNGSLWESPQHRLDMGFNLTTNRNRLEDLGGVPETGAGANTRLREGHPVQDYHAVKVVSAEWHGPPDFRDGGYPTVQCMLEDGTVEDCTDFDPGRHRVSYGKNGDPTWYGGFTTTLTLFNNLRLFSQLTYEGGNIMFGCRIGCSYGFFRISPQVTGDPVNGVAPDPAYFWMAEDLGNNDFGGAYKGDQVRIQTVSASYSLPSRWVERMMGGAGDVRLQVSANNLGWLWRAQEESGVGPITKGRGGRLIVDPNVQSAASSETSGSQSIMALYPSSSIVASVRVRF